MHFHRKHCASHIQVADLISLDSNTDDLRKHTGNRLLERCPNEECVTTNIHLAGLFGLNDSGSCTTMSLGDSRSCTTANQLVELLPNEECATNTHLADLIGLDDIRSCVTDNEVHSNKITELIQPNVHSSKTTGRTSILDGQYTPTTD